MSAKINGTAHPTAAKFYASRMEYLHLSATTFNKGINRAKRERRAREGVRK